MAAHALRAAGQDTLHDTPLSPRLRPAAPILEGLTVPNLRPLVLLTLTPWALFALVLWILA